MSSQIPTRRPTRVTRPTNDENAPSRIGALARTAAAKQSILGKNSASTKETNAPLKPSVAGSGAATASTRPRTALVTQDKSTLNTVAGKRKRDALGDATNGKAKTTIALSTKVTGLGGGTASVTSSTTSKGATNQRASSVSTNISNTTKENSTTAGSVRSRAPLGVKSKNVAAPAAAAADKAKAAQPVKPTVLARRPLGSKSTQSAVPSNLTISKTVTHTTVHRETKTQQIVRKPHAQKVTTTTKVEDVDVEEVDEDELRSHKRPRLSDEVEEKPLEEAKLANITVEEVKEVLQVVTAKPEDGEPEDLDKDDIDDPLMVAEYAVEIFDYLRKLEKSTMPHPNYMEAQKQLKPHMRGILGEWIIGIHRSLRMVPETLFIAMNLIDRFLSVRAISLEKVQLVGVVCLLIASKYEEICAPSIQMMLRFSAKTSTADEIKEAEKYVLKSVKYNLSYSSPITFLRRVSKADGFDAESRTLAKYLVEIFCVEYGLVAFPPSCISAAAMWLARLALDRGEWTANLAHYSGYKEAELLPAAGIMLNYILKFPQHPSIFEKYASKKFNKASVFMRSWALARWDEGSEIDLGYCLPALMEDSRQRVIKGLGGMVDLLDAPIFAGEEASK